MSGREGAPLPCHAEVARAGGTRRRLRGDRHWPATSGRAGRCSGTWPMSCCAPCGQGRSPRGRADAVPSLCPLVVPLRISVTPSHQDTVLWDRGHPGDPTRPSSAL